MFATKLKLAGLAIAAALTVTTGAIGAVTSPAEAAGMAAPATVVATVRYDDLNLRTAAGAERLNGRIRAAAERLCIEPGVKGLGAALAGIECRDALIAGASAQVRAAAGGETYASRPVLTLARGR